MTGRHAPRWARVLVVLYPRAWRARYGAELLDLLAADPEPRALADVLRGALDARLHPEELPGTPGELGPAAALGRLLWAAAVAAVVFCAFAKLSEDPVRGAPASADVFLNVFRAGCALTALALAAAVGPALLAAARRGWAQRRRDVVAALMTPAAALVGIGADTALAKALGSTAGHTERVVIFYAWGAIAAACVLGAAAGLAAALLRAGPVELPRVSRPIALAVALGASLALTGALGWGLAVQAGAPHAFARAGGLAAISLPVAWGLALAGLAGGAAWTLGAARAVPAP